ncbi:MAG: phage protease [Pseudomonadota bacterium]
MKVEFRSQLVELKVNQAAEVPEWVLLLRAGTSSTIDGVVYQVDDVAMNSMIREFQANQLDVVIDYEHQSLKGDKAPAAGWIKDLEARQDGLWARVEWTPTAHEHIANREYRYMSPVFWKETKSDRPVILANAALTNNPRIRDYPPIANNSGGIAMNLLQKLIGLFGLASTAGDEEVVAQVNGMVSANTAMSKALSGLAKLVGLDDKAGPEKVAEQVTQEVNKAKAAGGDKVLIPNSVLSILDLPVTAGENEVTGAIQGLKAGSGQHADLLQEINALKDRDAERTAQDLVDGGMKVGKLIPNQRDWALEYAKKDPKGFEAYLNKAPKVVPVSGLPGGPASQGAAAADAVQREVNSKLGLSEDDFKKYGQPAGEGV